MGRNPKSECEWVAFGIGNENRSHLDFDVLFGEKHPSVQLETKNSTLQNTGILGERKSDWVYIFTTGHGHNFSGNTQ